jgi:hypothetical protein
MNTEHSHMSAKFRQELRREFEISGGVAAWVLFAHLFVLASPLALIWAIDVYAGQLPIAVAHPTLIRIASAIYIGATAFEVAQNSADRWYLTDATRSVADLLFNAFMTLAFCMYTIGFYANSWLTALAVLLTAAYPVAYINNHPSHRGISGIVTLLATLSLYFVTGDPTVFLFVTLSGLGTYFIVLLMKQHNQWMHGHGAFSFGVAFLAWPLALRNAAAGEPNSWTLVIVVSVAIVVIAAVLTPWLSRLAATPRLGPG